ncbi:MAG: phosphate acyltransferase PlsX [Bacilli bacterium]|nr:phosphate acyltransferase PlsX [Bacilli bacterium]
MHFVLDIGGNDFGPKEVILGAIEAVLADKSLKITLVGDENLINNVLKEKKIAIDNFSIIDAKNTFSNSTSPTEILKGNEETSLYKALMAIREDENIDAFLTCGSTGATLVGSMFKIGRIQGIKRPCLMATVPSRTGSLVRVLDIGANMDAKPEYLYQYALMVNEFLKVQGVENPRIGLLNVGKEDEKGNQLTHETYELLKGNESLNFIGNIEADHILKGETDAVICDAFAGNVFIKTLEDTAYFVSDEFQKAIKKNIFTKFGALFQLPHLKKIKNLFKYANQASAPLLGIKKMVIKMHGKSSANNVKFAILEARNFVKGNLIEKIENSIK